MISFDITLRLGRNKSIDRTDDGLIEERHAASADFMTAARKTRGNAIKTNFVLETATANKQIDLDVFQTMLLDLPNTASSPLELCHLLYQHLHSDLRCRSDTLSAIDALKS